MSTNNRQIIYKTYGLDYGRMGVLYEQIEYVVRLDQIVGLNVKDVCFPIGASPQTGHQVGFALFYHSGAFLKSSAVKFKRKIHPPDDFI
jgi:hypothetical protein